ncbi:unnamed protein product [Ectocarpus sp. CCAP 1310/34]|nr:unnamed protein product [Ectocarpus sp. CCAP 1310/34]
MDSNEGVYEAERASLVVLGLATAAPEQRHRSNGTGAAEPEQADGIEPWCTDNHLLCC